jgi:fumarate reductase flavoprotein subunit
MGEGDGPDVHFLDTVKGSDWGADQAVVRLFVDRAPEAVREMAFWGIPWNRVVPGSSTYFKGGKEFEKVEATEKEGSITARDFGGTAKWRTCYTSDGTGHTLLYTMDNKVVELGVTVHDRVEAIALIHDGETCTGAVVRCLKTGKLRAYLAKATLIATGGSLILKLFPWATPRQSSFIPPASYPPIFWSLRAVEVTVGPCWM